MKNESVPHFRWRLRRLMGLLSIVHVNLASAVLYAKRYSDSGYQKILLICFTVETIAQVYALAILYKMTDELWQENRELVEQEKKWINSISPKTEFILLEIFIVVVYFLLLFYSLC